jgi:hypothetical protein
VLAVLQRKSNPALCQPGGKYGHGHLQRLPPGIAAAHRLPVLRDRGQPVVYNAFLVTKNYVLTIKQTFWTKPRSSRLVLWNRPAADMPSGVKNLLGSFVLAHPWNQSDNIIALAIVLAFGLLGCKKESAETSTSGPVFIDLSHHYHRQLDRFAQQPCPGEREQPGELAQRAAGIFRRAV